MHNVAGRAPGDAFGSVAPGHDAFEARYFRPLAALVLLLAAFNVFFRLSAEPVTEWDESLYAVSAVEMVRSDEWIATTFDGQLDYYNSKPPLNVWLLALSFKLLGTNLWSLRLVSACSAWATILALMWWTRREYGPATSLLSGAVLSTTFGFLFVHSGKSGNPDALMTLILLLIVIVMAAAPRRQRVLAWLGPLLAGVFFLKGLAVLMPLVFVAAVLAWWVRHRHPLAWSPLAVATILFITPIAVWMIARWRVDQWQFLTLLVTQDLIDVTTQVLDGHTGSILFYANALQRFQYEWVVAGVAALALAGSSLVRARPALLASLRRGDRPAFAIFAWTIVALGVPTIVRTKLWWYLNPFYPVFALGVGAVLALGLRASGESRWRRIAVAAVAVIALVAAESRIIWHSSERRTLDGTIQGLMIEAGPEVEGHTVFAAGWTRAERFVVRGVAGAVTAVARDVEQFLARSSPGDLFLTDVTDPCPDLVVVRTNSRYILYRLR